jgi:glucose-6-phosphate isomerase
MSRLTRLPEWAALLSHHERIRDVHMRDQFAAEPDRFARFSLQLGDILFDYSKNRIDDETMRLLLDLARACDVEGWRDRMFAGEPINHTERRAVQHCALRNLGDDAVMIDGIDVLPEVRS